MHLNNRAHIGLNYGQNCFWHRHHSRCGFKWLPSAWTFGSLHKGIKVMFMIRQLVAFSVLFSVCLPILAQDSPTVDARPPYERLLKDADAAKAADLGEQITKLEAQDDYAGAIQAAEELLVLRRRVQGVDHWEVTTSTYVLSRLKIVMKLPEDRRKAWREAREQRPLADSLMLEAAYAKALPLLRSFQTLHEQVLGEDHPDTAATHTNVADNLEAVMELGEAQLHYEKALEIRRRVLGENHPSTAMSYNNVAYNLEALGRSTEAQPLYRKALNIQRRVLGEDHPDTATSYNNLAANLNRLGRYSEAEQLYKKALEIQRRVLGEDHPDTATSYNNLAANLNDLGRFSEAEQLYKTALEIRQRVLGEYHPSTAASYNNVAHNLDALGKPAEAQPLYQKALDINRRVLGEAHPTTATFCNNVARNLLALGKAAEALPLFQTALDIRRRVLGEDHPDTATSYNNLAMNLNALGRFAEAQPLLQTALDIRRRVLGENHPDMAITYNNLAMNLNALGRFAEAQPLLQTALDILRLVLGENHPDTVNGYNNVAYNLEALGKFAEAQPLYQKALDISLRVLGEDHPDMATRYNNLAMNLDSLGMSAEAGPLLQKALEIDRRVLGEYHPNTARSYDNLAMNLDSLGMSAAAQTLFQTALDIRRRALGEDHPDTATSYIHLAHNLDGLGRFATAQSLYQKALDIRLRVFGEVHPNTVSSYNKLARSMLTQGNRAESLSVLKRAIRGHEASRLARAEGLERSILAEFNPRLAHAVLEAAADPQASWNQVELTLARGLLDEQAKGRLAAMSQAEQADRIDWQVRLASRQSEILKLVSMPNRSEAKSKALERLLSESQVLREKLADLAVRLSQREVAPAAAIRSALSTQSALILWVDLNPYSQSGIQEHWGCVVRATGEANWERLPGTGTDGRWTLEDNGLPSRFRAALSSRDISAAEIAELAKRLHTQRLAPLTRHLDGVTTLYVVPVEEMAGIPVEVLTDAYTVDYVPSGTFLAQLKDKPASTGNGLLALGDPVFNSANNTKPAVPTDMPPGGLLVLRIAPRGAADQAGLKAGDVLVRYSTTELSSVETLTEAVKANATETNIPVTVWREGRSETFVVQVPSGRLGVALAKEPAREAIANRRQGDALLLSLRGDGWNDLPGTRVELAQIASLFEAGATTLLVDSAASEQSLEALRQQKALSGFRYLHFATHGEGNDTRAFESALILAQDQLPAEPLPRAGEPFLNGQLSAQEVLDFWKLDADLVTLSACETAVGRPGGGEGKLGFAQAFLTAGARSVCLSLWKVDDTATALLMSRFYQNLLGKRPGLDRPMPKAAALAEAKRWLRNLSADEAQQLIATATKGVTRGDRGKGERLKPIAPPSPSTLPTKDSKPFADPRYWAAFILIGDPGLAQEPK